ncbi:MAG TPA: TonB family protein [Candidatus Rubrimentiphilum sp.]|nr:TonB family protein [Candidatus Rubrimentiphilum sp.]
MLIAADWYWRNPVAPVQEEITKARIVQISRTTPPPARTPAPKPLRASAQKAQKSPKHISVPQLRSHAGNASAQRAVAVQPTPRPVPARATPATGCPRPNASPALAATPDVAQLSASARASRVSGVAAIDVSLDADGHVLDTKVARSSGNIGLDAGAIAMARNAGYSPKYIACKGVASVYTFTVRFVAW